MTFCSMMIPLLGLELLDRRRHVAIRHHRVFVAVDDQPGRRAGGEEGEVLEVRRRRDRNKAVDLGAAHQRHVCATTPPSPWL
jgi:hypothetical protein